MNLLSNAIKYTSAGGHVQFEMYEKPAEDPAQVVLVSVIRDDGIGMTPEYQKVMLNRFTRAVDIRVNKERAENGAVCVEKFCAAPPRTYDAILMDMQMPVMDGLQATVSLRGNGRAECTQVPILAMTANAAEEDVLRCLDAGMNVHLSKPMDMPLLLQNLAVLCHRK